MPNPKFPDFEITHKRHGILFVLSAPSGAGKSTLVNRLREKPDFAYSVSCTTRAPRDGEVDGRDYHFLNREDFEKKIANGEFIEYAEVHGNFYGTLRKNILAHLANSEDVLLDIDVQGAAMIRSDSHENIRTARTDIFLMPSDMKTLEQRLRGRATETDEQIALRLHNAVSEMKTWRDYRYTLISDTREEDFLTFRAIMRAERNRSRRRFAN